MPKEKSKNQVNKMLSPEEQSLIETMVATGQQLLSMQDMGPETEGSSEVEEAIKKLLSKEKGQDMESENPEDMSAEKAAGGDGVTSDDPAETKITDQGELTEENLKEVGKSILSLLAKKNNPVQKSQGVAGGTMDPNLIAQIVIKAQEPLINEIKTLKKQNQDMQQFNANVLDALGITEEVEKSLDNQIKTPPTQEDVFTPQAFAKALVSEIANMNNGGERIKTIEKDHQGHDSVLKALPFLFKNNLKNQ